MNWDELAKEIEQELWKAPTDYLRAHWISKTMHPYQRGTTERYWKELILDAEFVKGGVLAAALDSPAGNPQKYEPFPLLSPQSIQHAYYIRMMERRGIDVRNLSICEIGGGYGNFARIIRNLGSNMRYQIVDLPVMHQLQQTFLKEACKNPRVEYTSIEQMEPAELLIGTFSISEMPFDQRVALEARYQDFPRIFIGLTESFCGFQNVPYFQGLAERIGAKFFKDKHRNAWFVVR